MNLSLHRCTDFLVVDYEPYNNQQVSIEIRLEDFRHDSPSFRLSLFGLPPAIATKLADVFGDDELRGTFSERVVDERMSDDALKPREGD